MYSIANRACSSTWATVCCCSRSDGRARVACSASADTVATFSSSGTSKGRVCACTIDIDIARFENRCSVQGKVVQLSVEIYDSVSLVGALSPPDQSKVKVGYGALGGGSSNYGETQCNGFIKHLICYYKLCDALIVYIRLNLTETLKFLNPR